MTLNQAQYFWCDKCLAAEGIRAKFGLHKALEYLVGEKLVTFLWLAEQHSDFAAELPMFVAEIRRLFTVREIRVYLEQLKRTKYFKPLDPRLKIYDLVEIDDPELDKMAIAESLRFATIRTLLCD